MMMSSTITTLRRLVHPIGSGSRHLPRTIHRSCVTQRQPDAPNRVSHTAENYFIDRDETAPPDNSIYRVDAASDAAQSAYEAPSRPWNRADADTAECQTINKDKMPNDPSVKLRYGGKKTYTENEQTRGGPRRQ